jgi:crotonobetainyl-CoA:carnitine CoA-transferase CaiB-like acyl-CoA transferase
VLDAMGYGYAAMSQINPRLIYCSVTLCGQSGPYRTKPGHDPVALSIAGALSRVGDRKERPSMPGVPVADLLSGSNAVIGVLAALHARHSTKRGQHVDIAMSDAAMTLIASTLSRNPDLTRVKPRGEDRVDCGLWKTKDDRFICTTDMEPRYWERFCRAIGREDFIPLQLDASRREEVAQSLGAIFAQRSLQEWLAVLGAADTQFAPVYEIAEALADPHNIARGMVRHVQLPDGSPARHIGSPIKLSETPAVEAAAAGLPGCDTVAVLRELGYGDNDIEALDAAGVIATTPGQERQGDA